MSLLYVYRADLKNFEFNETFEMDEDRPTTSASIFLEPARPGTPAASTFMNNNISAPVSQSFTTAPGVMLPPHHAFKQTGLTSKKPLFRPDTLQLLKPSKTFEAKAERKSLKTPDEPSSQTMFEEDSNGANADDSMNDISSSRISNESWNREVSGLSAVDITKIEI